MRSLFPGRNTEMPLRTVPKGSVVYAIGDVHGRPDLARLLLARIAADAKTRPAQRRVVVFLGDYVDRGLDSKGVIDLLLEEPPKGFEVHHLMGNHEDFMLRFLDGAPLGELWAMNGGDATLASYGLRIEESLSGPGGWEAVRRQLAERLPESHRRFLSELRLTHREGDVLFVHAGIRPGIPLAEQTPDDLLWIRDEFLESRADLGMLVVHGHTPTPYPEVRANRIGIDTGACMTGRLTALAIEGPERAFIAT